MHWSIPLALTPDKNVSFYREVDEELRRAQLGSFWKRYGKALLAAAVLLIAVAAGYTVWKNRQQKIAGQQSETLDAALTELAEGNDKPAQPRLDELARSKSAGYRAAALLTRADLALGKGEVKQASAAFGAIAGDPGLAQPYRDLALVRQTAAEFDAIPPALVISRLQRLAKPGNPWFGSAGEMVAAAHLKQRKPERAAPLFAAIAKDEGVPESIRARATQMAGTLGIDAIEDSPETNAAVGAPKE